MKKGVYYSLEAVMSTIMVISILYILVKNPPSIVDISKVNYKLRIHNSLKILSEGGLLRRYVLLNDTNSIKNELQQMLPSQVNVWVTIYDKNSQNLTVAFTPSIFQRNIIVVSYFISGDTGNYSPREVRVHAWGI